MPQGFRVDREVPVGLADGRVHGLQGLLQFQRNSRVGREKSVGPGVGADVPVPYTGRDSVSIDGR